MNEIDIEMAAGGFDHGRRRRDGEAAAEHEMIGIGGLDGGDRQREIAVRQQSGEGLAVGGGWASAAWRYARAANSIAAMRPGLAATD